MAHRLNKAVTLLSGGLDSTVATVIARREFDIDLALTFDYGQRAAVREIDTARSLCDLFGIEQQVIALPWLGSATKTALVNKEIAIPNVLPELLGLHDVENAKAVWVPNRNGVFISIAAALAESRGCSAIITGFNAEEAQTFPDNSMEFVAAINRSLKFSTTSGTSLMNPLIKLGKVAIAEQFVALNIDPLMFWCCYFGEEKLCGRCESCARSMRAFQKIGAWGIISRRFKQGEIII